MSDELRQCPLTTADLASGVLLFIETVSDIEFYSYQRASALRIVESLLANDGDSITLLFARQSGKSEEMADLALGLAIVLPVLARAFPDDPRLSRLSKIRIGIFGPNQESTGPIYERIRMKAESEHVQGMLEDPEIGMHLVQSRGDSITFNLGSYIKAKTASDAAFVEGGTFHLIILDEAQKISTEKVNKEISPMRAATNGTMVKIGTAWMSAGGFHTDIKTNILVESKGGRQNHFQYDYEVVVREKAACYERQRASYELYRAQLLDWKAGVRSVEPDAGLRTRPPDETHLNYAKFIQGEIRRLGGTHSEEFKMNFRLLWQESRAIAFSEKVIASAAGFFEATAKQTRGIQVAGLDIAKEGDSTVLTIVEVDTQVTQAERDKSSRQSTPVAIHFTKRVLAWLELQGSFEHVQYDAIVEFMANFNVRRLVGDATGMGDPVVERLSVLLRPLEIEVVPFVYSTSSKSDLFKYYIQEFVAGRFKYPAGPQTMDTREFREFVEQHADLTRGYSGNYLYCEASTATNHDDYPCSAALACYGARDVVSEMEIPTIQSTTWAQVAGNRHASYRAASRSDRYRSRR
jgi:Terminase large subunit, T4likevirus-type, N-terminal